MYVCMCVCMFSAHCYVGLDDTDTEYTFVEDVGIRMALSVISICSLC